MPKRTHRRKPSSGPRSRRDVAGRRERRSPDLIDEVAGALATAQPLDLLALTSSFLAATDPRERRLLGARDEPSLPPRQEIVDTFFEVPLPETSTLLTAVAVLTGDDVLCAPGSAGRSPPGRTCSPTGSPSCTGRGRTTAPCR